MTSRKGETIAAIATPLGEGAIAIVRLSGPGAIRCVSSIFRGRRRLEEAPSHTLVRGAIVDPAGNPVDDVLVSVMRAPHTFTGEDIVEINCHGGRLVVETVLRLVLDSGARLAEPGEFTQRAFLNGRIDLAQAEAVIDIVRARSPVGLQVAAKQLEGELSRRVTGVREKLLHLLGRMQVVIDYPEEDLGDVSDWEVGEILSEALRDIEALLAGAEAGKVYREGVRAAIVGRPNVGKSSLLNALLREERAIVTEIAGTTRDTIDAEVVLGGIPLTLVDTAGLRKTEDPVEKVGIERTRAAIDRADLVLVVVDGSEPLGPEDEAVFDSLKEAQRERAILVVNKADLPSVVSGGELEEALSGRPVVRVSAHTGEGLDRLEEEVRRTVLGARVGGGDEILVTRERHRRALRGAEQVLRTASESLALGMTYDVISVDLQQALASLGSITGEQVGEELVAHIFAEFCVGK